jgi:hypothetical protein
MTAAQVSLERHVSVVGKSWSTSVVAISLSVDILQRSALFGLAPGQNST